MTKTLLLLFIFITFSHSLVAQTWENSVASWVQAYTDGDRNGMHVHANDMIKAYPEEYYPHVLKAFAHLASSNPFAAGASADILVQMQPGNSLTWIVKAYHAQSQSNSHLAEQYLAWSLQLDTERQITDTRKDILKLEKLGGYDMQPLLAAIDQLKEKYPISLSRQWNDCVYSINNNKGCDLITIANEIAAQSYPNKYLLPLAAHMMGVAAYQNGTLESARRYFKTVVNNPSARELMPMQHGLSSYYLAIIAEAELNYEQAQRYALDASRQLVRVEHLPGMRATALEMTVRMANATDDATTLREVAEGLLALGTKMDDKIYIAKGKNALAILLQKSVSAADRRKAAEYLYDAMVAARATDDKSLLEDTMVNYAISKFQTGNIKDAIDLADQAYDSAVQRNAPISAAETANSLGFMLYTNQRYAEAAVQFEKSSQLTESRSSSLRAEEKLRLRDKNSAARAGLIMALGRNGDASRMFAAQEQNRSRYLLEQLGGNNYTASIDQAQSLLSPNEVLLFYSMGEPGELYINVITPNGARVVRSYPLQQLLAVKKMWTDRATEVPAGINPAILMSPTIDVVDGNIVKYASPASNYKATDFHRLVEWTRQVLEDPDPKYDKMQKDFLQLWYRMAIAPVQQDIVGKDLILSLDGRLHFLPFEAFMDQQGSFLIEKNDVRYIPSIGVLQKIKERSYTNDRKPVIAFGGATYQKPPVPGSSQARVLTQSDVLNVEEAVTDKLAQKNFNFSSELEIMGFGGANYLKGTLDEVKLIATLSEEAQVYTGPDMRESHIKALDKSGKLADYRIIHLASHGFSSSVIPAFSGVMCTQPDNGDGSEDMFLLAPEIARLQLKADLAVLSACDTGIGKLLGGEGFNGLNSAFLQAGANATLLSLWPVNDTGTMVLMQNLYNDVIINGNSIPDAVNRIKRAMATGQLGTQLQDPYMWAPFVLNGK